MKKLEHTSSFYIIKELDFSNNKFISTFGLSKKITKSIDPWMSVN